MNSHIIYKQMASKHFSFAMYSHPQCMSLLNLKISYRISTENSVLAWKAQRPTIEKLRRRPKLYALATDTVYQTSIGVRRNMTGVKSEKLYDAFGFPADHRQDDKENDMIRLAPEGAHRIYFINSGAIDYLSIPTHTFEEGRLNALAEVIDEREDLEGRPAERADGRSGSVPAKRGRAKRVPPTRRVPTRR